MDGNVQKLYEIEGEKEYQTVTVKFGKQSVTFKKSGEASIMLSEQQMLSLNTLIEEHLKEEELPF